MVYIGEKRPPILKRYFKKSANQFFNTKLGLSVSLFERKHSEAVAVVHVCFQANSENERLKLIQSNEHHLQSEFSHRLETSGELLVAVR